MSFTMLLILYLCFRFKQVACDFLLQTKWMALGKTAVAWTSARKPLFVHAGIHALGTLGIMLIFAPFFWWVALVDFIVHASIDRAKALIVRRGAWSTQNWQYWWAHGLDQEAHNLTHLMYIVLIYLSTT